MDSGQSQCSPRRVRLDCRASLAKIGVSHDPFARLRSSTASLALGTIGGTALSLLNVNPIKLLVFVAVINGVIAAPLLIIVLLISNSRHLMGDYVDGHVANILGWFTFALMAVASIALFATGGISF